ncbi:MAG: hypothetical protein ACUVQI_04745 [Thermochromatium sp.]
MPSVELLDPLSSDDRRILQVLSVVYETVTQTQLLEILRRLG